MPESTRIGVSSLSVPPIYKYATVAYYYYYNYYYFLNMFSLLFSVEVSLMEH